MTCAELLVQRPAASELSVSPSLGPACLACRRPSRELAVASLLNLPVRQKEIELASSPPGVP